MIKESKKFRLVVKFGIREILVDPVIFDNVSTVEEIEILIKDQNRIWNEYDRDPIYLLTGGKHKILIIEDDKYLALEYADILKDGDIDISIVNSADDAIRLIRGKGKRFDLIIFDIRMESGKFLGKKETYNGRRTGVVLAKSLLDINDSTEFVALTISNDASDQAFFENIENGVFINKFRVSDNILRSIIKIKLMGNMHLQSFIVHGHDSITTLELKDYLQNNLELPEPIILHQQPSRGRTVIEKFEEISEKIDVAFILLTPDDIALDKDDEKIKRARQNVIFELGYFVGRFGRKSGKVILLYKGDIEMPSNLSGVLYINISDGIEAAGEKIRKELESIYNSY